MGLTQHVMVETFVSGLRLDSVPMVSEDYPLLDLLNILVATQAKLAIIMPSVAGREVMWTDKLVGSSRLAAVSGPHQCPVGVISLDDVIKALTGHGAGDDGDEEI